MNMLLQTPGLLFTVFAFALASKDDGLYHGKYGGRCDKDGFYFKNLETFVICSNDNAYVQPCAPGTRNSDYNSYSYGGRYNYRDFCDVNLVDHGYGVHHGYSQKHQAYGNTYDSHDVPTYRIPHGSDGYTSGHDSYGSKSHGPTYGAPHGNTGYNIGHDFYGSKSHVPTYGAPHGNTGYNIGHDSYGSESHVSTYGALHGNKGYTSGHDAHALNSHRYDNVPHGNTGYKASQHGY